MSNNKIDMIEGNYKNIKYSYDKELKEELAAMDIDIEQSIKNAIGREYYNTIEEENE